MTDAYARAGVDIDAGNETVERYREVTSDWRHPDQLGELGGFSGLFRLPGDGSRALVASTDGVGTKILIAAQLGRYDGVGRDLVNHCVNDILVVSATPLFFLDYLAVGKLEPAMAAEVVRGVAQACRANGMALLGGETAEMPGLYKAGDFDLAGTIVGHRRHRRRFRTRIGSPGRRDPRAAVGRAAHQRLHAGARADRARGIRAAVRRHDLRRRAARPASRRTAPRCARSSGSPTSRRWRTSPAAA